VQFTCQVSWCTGVDGSERNGPELEMDTLANIAATRCHNHTELARLSWSEFLVKYQGGPCTNDHPSQYQSGLM